MAQYKAFLWDMDAYEKAPHPTLHDPIAKSRDHLMRSRTLWKTIPSIDFRGPRVRTPEEIELLGKPGGEHYVELTPDRKHVLKHTKGGRFGKRLLLSPDGKSIVSDYSTASQYLGRLYLNNVHFQTEYELLGSHSYEGGGFTTKQQFFSKVLVEVDKDGNPKRMSDVHEAEGDIERYMKGRGYWQVDGSKFAGKPLATWYHPTAGILVTDAKWANFRRDDQGFLRPLDLGVQTSR